MTNKIKIVCVLKSGGVYTEEYVTWLKDCIAKHTTLPYEFVCLSDLLCATTKLRTNLTGWWSKLELFLIPGPCLFMDLDTHVVGSIDPYIRAITESRNTFFGLRPLGWGDIMCSGVMGWSGDWSWLIQELTMSQVKYFKGDQQYIAWALNKHDVPWKHIDSYHPGIYSYKWECQPTPPPDTRIICFHGTPKPHDLGLLKLKEPHGTTNQIPGPTGVDASPVQG